MEELDENTKANLAATIQQAKDADTDDANLTPAQKTAREQRKSWAQFRTSGQSGQE